MNVIPVYTYQQKKILADKLGRIKSKTILTNVFKIIHQDTQQFTENDNGVFVIFNNLSNETYYKIDCYLNSMKKNRNVINDSDSEQNIVLSDSANSNKSRKLSETQLDENYESKLKYSNKEKSIIKRQIYESLSTESINSNVVYTPYEHSSDSPDKKIQ